MLAIPTFCRASGGTTSLRLRCFSPTGLRGTGSELDASGDFLCAGGSCMGGSGLIGTGVLENTPHVHGFLNYK